MALKASKTGDFGKKTGGKQSSGEKKNRVQLKPGKNESYEPLLFLDAFDITTKFGETTMMIFTDPEGTPEADYDDEGETLISMDGVVYPEYVMFADKASAFGRGVLDAFTEEGSESESHTAKKSYLGKVFKIGKSGNIKSKSTGRMYNELRYALLDMDDYDADTINTLIETYEEKKAEFASEPAAKTEAKDDGDEHSPEYLAAVILFEKGKKMTQVIKALVADFGLDEDEATDIAMEAKQNME